MLHRIYIQTDILFSKENQNWFPSTLFLVDVIYVEFRKSSCILDIFLLEEESCNALITNHITFPLALGY